jgi:hypothetical protein
MKSIGPMSLRALHYLITHGPSTADTIGIHVWAGRKRGKTTSMGGGGDYAAQMLLGRLKSAGLVQQTHGEGSTRWEIATRGRQVAAKGQS